MITKENYYKKLGLKLKITTRTILDMLIKFSDKDYTCYPGQDYIAKELNVSRATVNRHIKKLEKLKYITIIKNRTTTEQQFDNNIYFLNVFFIAARGSIKNIKNILKNSYRYIEKKLYKDIERKKGKGIKDIYEIEEEKNINFNIDNFINELIDKTKLKKINVLSTIVNIQNQMQGEHIFNIKNYINKSFENAINEQNIRDKINITANALPEDYKENLRLIL